MAWRWTGGKPLSKPMMIHDIVSLSCKEVSIFVNHHIDMTWALSVVPNFPSYDSGSYTAPTWNVLALCHTSSFLRCSDGHQKSLSVWKDFYPVSRCDMVFIEPMGCNKPNIAFFILCWWRGSLMIPIWWCYFYTSVNVTVSYVGSFVKQRRTTPWIEVILWS